MEKLKNMHFDFLMKLAKLTLMSFDLGLLISYDVFNYNESKTSQLKHFCKDLSGCGAQKPTQLTVLVFYPRF